MCSGTNMSKARILVVEDERLNINILVSILTDDYEVVVAKNGEQAIKRVQDQVPDLVLLDIILPDMNGYEVFEKMQELVTDPLPIIFITSKRSPEEETKGLKLGAVDYITKPFTPSIVEVRIANQIEYKRNRDELKRLNRTDALTGIANRRHLDEYLALQKARTQKKKAALSLIMVDIDYFKQYNDHYGHASGDDCLKQVALTLSEQLYQATDFVARYGGEEFAIVLAEVSKEEALSFAQVLQNAIIDKQIPHQASTVSEHVTISLGIATLSAKDCDVSAEELFERADKALYQAKVEGRNRYVVCEQ